MGQTSSNTGSVSQPRAATNTVSTRSNASHDSGDTSSASSNDGSFASVPYPPNGALHSVSVASEVSGAAHNAVASSSFVDTIQDPNIAGPSKYSPNSHRNSACLSSSKSASSASNSACATSNSECAAINTTNSAPNSVSPSHSNSSPSHSASGSNSFVVTAGTFADSASSQLKENLQSLHHQLMQHAGADYDIATTTTLSYTQFLSYITQLNQICRLYQDDDGHVLVFAVKKGTDSSIFWKATVRIACVKYLTRTNTTESHRLLNIRQFLQVFRRISYECTAGSLGTPPSPSHAAGSSSAVPVAPTTAAAAVLGEIASDDHHPASAAAGGDASGGESSSGGGGRKAGRAESLEECIICLEREPEVILPCAHAYCLPCIQQWWEYTTAGPLPNWHCHPLFSMLHVTEMERTCPICREAIADDDDTWVISEAPDDAQVTSEISKTLMGLAGPSSGSGSSKGAGGNPNRRSN